LTALQPKGHSRRLAQSPARSWRSGLDLWIPAAATAFIVIACFVWPLLGDIPRSVDGNIGLANLPAGSAGHLLGTDTVGNDVLARVLAGGRVALEVGVATNVIGLIVGGSLGILAAAAGGASDMLVARSLDILIAFPAVVLALLIAADLGPGELHVILALTFFTVPAYARLARAHALQVRGLDFVQAARLSGARTSQTFGHLIPNVLPRLLTFSFLGVSLAITFEASLSFLGLGVVPPAASWGDMIAQGQEYLVTNPGLALIPSACLVATVVSVNLTGDAVRTRLASR
jgi:peptide/nickel transport system permease protein